MVRRDYVSIVILSIANLICLSAFMLNGIGYGYRYLAFTFQWQVFIIQLIVLVAIDVMVAMIYLLGRKTVKGLIITAIVFILCLWLVFIVCGFFGSAYWSSQCDKYNDDFDLDDSLNNSMKIGGVVLSDILSKATSSCGEFHYYYRVLFGCSQFSLKGDFRFSENDYKDILASFGTAPEFVLVYDNADGDLGHIQLLNNVPFWESKTSWGKWNRFIIRFSDVDNTIYFDLFGELDA